MAQSVLSCEAVPLSPHVADGRATFVFLGAGRDDGSAKFEFLLCSGNIYISSVVGFSSIKPQPSLQPLSVEGTIGCHYLLCFHF